MATLNTALNLPAPDDFYERLIATHRGLSDEAAARLGVRHETPQAILLRDGRPVWSASHFRITKQQLDAAIDS